VYKTFSFVWLCFSELGRCRCHSAMTCHIMKASKHSTYCGLELPPGDIYVPDVAVSI